MITKFENYLLSEKKYTKIKNEEKEICIKGEDDWVKDEFSNFS